MILMNRLCVPDPDVQLFFFKFTFSYTVVFFNFEVYNGLSFFIALSKSLVLGRDDSLPQGVLLTGDQI